MIARILQHIRHSLRGSFLGKVLRSTGIVGMGRRFYETLVVNKGIHTCSVMGVPMTFAVRSSTEVTRIDSLQGEEAFVERIVKSLRPDDVFYDIGANIGMISILVAKKLQGKHKKICCFEPEPANAQELRENLQLNGLCDIGVHEFALGDKEGTCELFVSGDVGAGSHSLASGYQEGARAVEIEIQRGDYYAERTGFPPDVIKLDVEGAELSVLRGFEQTLRGGRLRELFVEVHPEAMELFGDSADDLKRWMESHCYECRWSDARGRQFHQHYVFAG